MESPRTHPPTTPPSRLKRRPQSHLKRHPHSHLYLCVDTPLASPWIAGIFNLGGFASGQLTGGYSFKLGRPFFGYQIKLMGDLKPSKNNFNYKIRRSPHAARGHIVFKTSAKVNWEVPTISGVVDEEGHVESDQDWGNLFIQIPHVDLKLKLNPGAVKDKDKPPALA